MLQGFHEANCRDSQGFPVHPKDESSHSWCCEKFSDLKAVKIHSGCSYGFIYNAFYVQLELNRRKKLPDINVTHVPGLYPSKLGIQKARKECKSY